MVGIRRLILFLIVAFTTLSGCYYRCRYPTPEVIEAADYGAPIHQTVAERKAINHLREIWDWPDHIRYVYFEPVYEGLYHLEPTYAKQVEDCPVLYGRVLDFGFSVKSHLDGSWSIPHRGNVLFYDGKVIGVNLPGHSEVIEIGSPEHPGTKKQDAQAPLSEED